MTLGGVDPRIHKSSQDISFAKLYPSNGWYGVKVLDIQFQSQATNELIDIGIPNVPGVIGSGKGTIVDSGTTDTYLPAAMASAFKKKFKDITGIDYSNQNMAIDASRVAKLPNIVFSIVDAKDESSKIKVTMPWTSYTDTDSGGKYVFRIYLTEGSGAVLGANFMNGYG